jgi:transcriptional regulator with XRE-family HTH domain
MKNTDIPDETENRFGKNLQHVRKIYGETLQDVGTILGYGATTIKNYESGKRQPDPITLQILAKHYGKPVDELLYSDLSELTPIQFSVNGTVELVEMLKTFFPLSCSEKSLKSPAFKKGYNYCCRILDAFSRNDTIRGSIIKDCAEAFECALEEIDDQGNIVVPEAIANMIWLIFLEWTQIYDENTLNVYQSLIFPGRRNASLKDFLNLRVKESDEIKQRRESFIQDMDGVVVNLLNALKSDFEWMELADYYLALRYLISMVDTGLSTEMNSTIGMQMMLSFLQLGNPYAFRLVEMCID